MEIARLPFRDELRPDDRHLAGRLDPQTNLSGLQPDDRHADVIPNKQPLHQLPG
jgi:hypothetical protein